MTRRLLTTACILGSFACGAVTASLVQPTAAHATEGQLTECFTIRDVVSVGAEFMSPTYTPKGVTLIPNGWTVVGAGSSDVGTQVVVCR